jgi:uncharacterized protein YfkK (UPF0435 family)
MDEEQTLRGWPDASLAKRVSEYFPMAPATIWKIKSADPPRRVDLDEGQAIARAFGYTSTEDFLNGASGSEWVLGEVLTYLQQMVNARSLFSETTGKISDLYRFSKRRKFTQRQVTRILLALRQLRESSDETARRQTEDMHRLAGVLDELIAVFEAKVEEKN